MRVRWGRRGEEGVRVRGCGTYLCSDPSFEVVISQNEAEELQGGRRERVGKEVEWTVPYASCQCSEIVRVFSMQSCLSLSV